MPNLPKSSRSKLLIFVILAIVVIGPAIYLFAGSGDRDLAILLRENGFTELRPPSNLIMPGSFVVVTERSPLRVATVCGPLGAFGIGPSDLAQYASADVSTSRAFEGSYKVDISWLGSIAGEGSRTQTADLVLRNVRILELSDEEVRERLSRRSKACQEALMFRHSNDPNTLTLVDSVLLADAEYKIRYQEKAAGAVETKDMVESAGLTLKANEDGTSVLIGKGLVWGIRDDQRKVPLGLGLPATGAADPGVRRSLIPKESPIVNVDSSKQARLSDEEFRSVVRVDLDPLRQPTVNSCWSTVYAMMQHWKTKSKTSIEEAVRKLGPEYLDYFLTDDGLPFGRERTFAKDAGLVAEPPASYPLSFFRDLLRNSGPLWIISGNGLTSHAQLLTGVYSDSEEESRETYETSVIEYIDPAIGAYVYEPALSFVQRYEAEAAFVVQNDAMDSVDLRWQILHFPES